MIITVNEQIIKENDNINNDEIIVCKLINNCQIFCIKTCSSGWILEDTDNNNNKLFN
jgi:hypothetical protein